MVRQGVIVVVPADGAQGGGESTEAGHVKSVIARSDQDGGRAWREGGREGGRNCRNGRWRRAGRREGGREEAAEGFEADDALGGAILSPG